MALLLSRYTSYLLLVKEVKELSQWPCCFLDTLPNFNELKVNALKAYGLTP